MVLIWRIKRDIYGRKTKADFTILPAIEYSKTVEEFRSGQRVRTGRQVAIGEVAKRQGGTWVRNFNLPLQYKFEGYSGVQGLKFSGAFSPGPLH